MAKKKKKQRPVYRTGRKLKGGQTNYETNTSKRIFKESTRE